MPNFDEISTKQVEQKRPQATSREQNTNLTLIAALLSLVEGTSVEPKHPSFETRPKLAKLLRAMMGEYPGLGESTILGRFKKAETFVDMR